MEADGIYRIHLRAITVALEREDLGLILVFGILNGHSALNTADCIAITGWEAGYSAGLPLER